MARGTQPAAGTPPRRVADPDAERVTATRSLLLDTAERLFAEKGYDQVSVRAINAAAGLNPGAVHYHFGSKPGLVAALLEARLTDVVSGTRARFEALLAAERIDITDVVRLQVEPLVELVRRPGPGRLHVRLLARAHLSGWELSWTSPYFRPGTWAGLAARALPHLPAGVVGQRWRLATELALVATGRPLHEDPEAELTIDADQLVAFIAAGLAAPVDKLPSR